MGELLRQGCLVLTMALMMVISLRMQAIMMSLNGLPACCPR